MSRELVQMNTHAVVEAGRHEATETRPGRRRFLKMSFWASLGALAIGAGAAVINSLYPRGVTGFGGPVVVKAAEIPAAGAAPKPNIDGHFLLVNLAPDEGGLADDAGASAGGLLALWWKCPHLGCTVPWKDFVSPHDPLKRRGCFNCPCHGSTYTKAGVRFFGPAPRSMDTMQVEVAANGDITVQTANVVKGGVDNPQRAIPWMPPS